MTDFLRLLNCRLTELPVCRSLDEHTFADLGDDEIEQAIINYVEGKLASRGEHRDEASVIDALPPGVRALYLTWLVESEVINGGFARYFWKWTGQFAEQAVEAFEFFSAKEYAKLMREVNRVHAEECGMTPVVNGRELLDVSDSWRLMVLEDYFHQIDETLSQLRVFKIRAYPKLFCETACRGSDVAGA